MYEERFWRYQYHRASKTHPAVRPWEWFGYPARPVPPGWLEWILVFDTAEREADAARAKGGTPRT